MRRVSDTARPARCGRQMGKALVENIHLLYLNDNALQYLTAIVKVLKCELARRTRNTATRRKVDKKVSAAAERSHNSASAKLLCPKCRSDNIATWVLFPSRHLCGECNWEWQGGFKSTLWWDNHRKITRHHLLDADGVRDDVNLIDVLDMITDCVMAGMGRAGKVYPLDIPADVLMRAFHNTAKLLEKNVVVSPAENKE